MLVNWARSAALNAIDRIGGAGRWHGRRPLPKTPDATGIAFVGCGFVADFYGLNLRLHPELCLVGVFDRDQRRAERLATVHGGRVYRSLDELLADPAVEIVINLTNPASHHSVSKAALLAGKHVYSEKPLGWTMEEATDLVATADRLGMLLSCAPSTHLGPSLRTLQIAINQGRIGQPRLVYAELDDGPIHRMAPDSWESPSGIPWPWRDEFSVGCTIEHAAYHVGWMAMLFGRIESVAASTARLFPAKHPDLPEPQVAPDLSIAVLRFESGVVARLTCSTIASHDHSLRVVGDEGELSIGEIWHIDAPVRLRRFTDIGLRAASYGWINHRPFLSRLLGSGTQLVKGGGGLRSRFRRHEIDYALGIVELARASKGGTPPILSGDLALHVTEVVLAIARAEEHGTTVRMSSSSALRAG